MSREALIALAREQAGVIAQLREANSALEQRVRQLERWASRNSGNSSMPPASDDLAGRVKPAPKRARSSGRKRGKQKGAPGSALSWVSSPTERVAHRPVGDCGCGADLSEAAEVGIVRSHQVHDLPEIRIRVSQHDVYRVRCGCGAEHVGSLPAQVSAAPSSYGPHLRALVVYLLIYQHVPVARCVQLIADLTGEVGPSGGFVHGMLARCADAVREVVGLIKTLITMAHVVGFDETTLRCGPAGQKKYVLSASTETATVYHLGGRDLDSFADFGILPDFAGVAVHDRYPNYFHPRWKRLAGHQACTAHLLRDFADAAEVYPDAHWPPQAQRALRGLIRAWHTARDTGLAAIPADVRDPLLSEFRHAIRVGLAQVPRVPGPRQHTKQHPGRDLLEFCGDRDDVVLGFCSDTRIWPTNNISERDLRPTKTQQKISGRLTSEDATRDRLDIRSYLDTARKHGTDVLTALRQAITGNPWKPPLTAPT
ncbi:MAG: IS66 family transposase [Actinobacteria bacterium]|nr:IS66 family transposase [Actinomycetota bacterium]